MIRFISYLRVSTDKQGQSGLGLEAQREAVERHLHAADGALAQEYVEVESGKRSDRPQLRAALVHARRIGAMLVIAKLDRLARNLAFIATLMDGDVEFVACDNPHANRLTLHILAAVAEDEARRISERTKAALAAAKARGTVLGGFRGYRPTASDRQRAAESKQKAADDFARDMASVIEALGAEGITSARGVARALTDRGIRTPAGRSTWQARQVIELRRRMAGKLGQFPVDKV